jgi:hypothetical protein
MNVWEELKLTEAVLKLLKFDEQFIEGWRRTEYHGSTHGLIVGSPLSLPLLRR